MGRYSHSLQDGPVFSTIKSFTKLTDVHVDPYIKKMKVSCASHVLSHSVASVISLMVKSGTTVNGMQLQPSTTGTSNV